MAKLSAVKQSLTKQNQGVWITWEGMRFRVGRIGNAKAKALIAEESARNRERKERGEPQRAWDDFWPECIAKAILLDWADVEREDGSVWPFSVEDALAVLKDPAFSDLRQAIELEAASRENFLEQADQAAEKN